MIGLGSNNFLGAQLAAFVMVLKQNKVAKKKGKALFIDASDQLRVGRAQNYLEPEHVNQIFDCYKAFSDVEYYLKVAELDDLEENDFQPEHSAECEEDNRRQLTQRGKKPLLN